MNNKILVIAFSWLATILGLVLLSDPIQSKPQDQAALILAAPSPIHALALTPTLTPLPATPAPTPSPSPTPTSFPNPTSAPTPPNTPSQASTPLPTPSLSAHIFYTSSHWKAKYYYCDTDDDWKNLSPTYLKSFSSEPELLAAYSRVLHEPCKN